MLLNKHNLNIAKLAPKESRYAYAGIRVEPKRTIVTDGHVLMTVSTSDMDSAAYPIKEESGLHAVDDFKPFNLTSDHALALSKAIPRNTTVPALGYAAVAVNGNPDAPKVVVNDLANQIAFPPAEKDSYPSMDRVIDGLKPATITIGFDARKLKPILEQFIAFCDAERSKNVGAFLKCELSAPDEPIRMEMTIDGQTMLALLMPCRL